MSDITAAEIVVVLRETMLSIDRADIENEDKAERFAALDAVVSALHTAAPEATAEAAETVSAMFDADFAIFDAEDEPDEFEFEEDLAILDELEQENEGDEAGTDAEAAR